MSNPLKTILYAGLAAGTLDITAAVLNFMRATGKSPVMVLQYIASAVFGKTAYGDNNLWIWGLVFHYVVAFGFTILFYVAYQKIRVFGSYPVISGLLYGVFVWIAMNLAVVPMTLIGKFPADPVSALINLVILMLMIGLPISLIVNRMSVTQHRE
ncbi:hypothetical protein [Hufsiella ginkgonis]|uniref:DUF1440 domain-containing protein n=1 Tax=Hufsiella ginkgonis TaxID=2695274 RepID=A0A7K1XWC2_9SPHI|nr:hypothetical protein [Hufsiella ginkgonis]MXV15295.1 hypothetical protein [Hufsiella ginkgonis]